MCVCMCVYVCVCVCTCVFVHADDMELMVENRACK